MKLLLLCLGLTLICVHPKVCSEVVTKNFEISKLSGEWYTILLASNFIEVLKENDVMRGFLNYVNVFNNSSLALKFHAKVNGECVPVSVPAEKTSENDVFTLMYPILDRFRMIEAVYDDYMIIYGFNSNSEHTFFAVGLYARTPDESPEIKNEFTRIVQKYGIPKNNVLDITKTDRCLQARDNQAAQDSRLVMSDGEGWHRDYCLLVYKGFVSKDYNNLW